MRLSSYLRYSSSSCFTLHRQPASAARAPAGPPPRVSLAARHQPWPSMSNPAAWNAVLEQYARSQTPERDLPKGVHLLSNSKCVTIFDGYEKAKYHFLVLPRDPFPLESSSSPSSASTSTSISVPSSHLTSLEALRKSPHCIPVLKALQEQAQRVQEMIEQEMLKNEGWKWPVHIGFHARESMRHVHLHVISSDLISPKLKNKKHYNSFHPSLGFFLHLTKVIEQVEASRKDANSTSSYENLLKLPLRSHYTGQQYPTIPKLKVHLEEEWERRGREERRRQALLIKDGLKAPSDAEERDRGADSTQGRAKKVKVDRTEEDDYTTRWGGGLGRDKKADEKRGRAV